MPVYMKYGSVTGDATQAGFEGWINVIHFHWLVNRSVTNKATGHGHSWDAKKPEMKPFEIRKEADAASTQLLEAMCRSTEPDSCTIRFVRTGAEYLPYMEYVFSNAILIQIDTAADDRPIETLTFNFDAVEVTVFSSEASHDRGTMRRFPPYNLLDQK